MLKLEEVVEVALDLIERKVDQHTGDLGSKVFADELLDVLIDELTHEVLEVGVLRDDTREHAETLHVVGINLRVRVGQVSGTLNLDSSCCGEGTSGDRNREGSRLVVA